MKESYVTHVTFTSGYLNQEIALDYEMWNKALSSFKLKLNKLMEEIYECKT